MHARRPDDAPPRVRAAELAARQHGVIHLEQARGLGVSDDVVYRLVQRGEWRRLLPRVYAISPGRDAGQWPMAACLWGGENAAASHRCAGERWELDGVPSGFLEIAIFGRVRNSKGVVTVHTSQLPFAIHRVDGIPVTSATRTMLDLSAVLPEERLELALEDALRRRLTSIPRIERSLEAAAGARGAAALRRLVARRRGDATPTQTMFEARLLQTLAANGFPPPRRQHPVRLPDVTVRLDFAYPSARVGIEADSYRWHSGRAAWERDRVRLSQLAAAGWQVLHVTYDELRRGAPDLIAALRRLVGPSQLYD